MKKISFIGVGIMGKSMVRNLMKNGYELSVYARNKSKVEDVIAEGAAFYDTIKDCVKNAEAVITIVGFPKDVEEVYFGCDGILENAPKGCYIIDMTTSSPKLAKRIFCEAENRGLHAMDAPVTGGDVGAKNGTLSILAGGEETDYEACLSIFEAMGTNINYEGAAGNGQHTKMANQIMIAGTLSGVCEAIAYAKKKGLNMDRLMNSVSTGAAGSRQLDLLGPKILEGDYAPGFFIKHFIKDMRLADEEAQAEGLTLSVLEQALSSFMELEKSGKGDLGTQALIQYYMKEEAAVPDKNIMLIGFMGSGKSTIAACLQEKYGMKVVEMDALIVEKEGMSINDIFEKHGEQYFRDCESRLIMELQKESGLAVSCGGGVVLREENVINMKKNGAIVLLNAAPDTIYERVKDSNDRPLLNGNMNVEYIAGLMEKRRDKYEKAADIIIQTDHREAEDICEEIVNKIRVSF